MSALTLLIIRHAEKPNDTSPDAGLTVNGTDDQKSLVVRGWQRAGAWAALFGAGLGGHDYPQPGIVYAAGPGGNDNSSGADDGPSKRPFETIIPLCARLHLEPVTKWAEGQEAGLVAEVAKLTGVALICWEHKHIAHDILPLIVKDQTMISLPSKWDGQRFDVALRFDRVMAGAPWSFRQLFPRLLAGDSDVPLGR